MCVQQIVLRTPQQRDVRSDALRSHTLVLIAELTAIFADDVDPRT